MSYLVCHGPYQRTREDFATFGDALACYRAHAAEKPEGAALYGENYDGAPDGSDGLTDEERGEVETG